MKTNGRIELNNDIDYDNEANPCIASVLASRVAVFFPSKRNIDGVSKWESETVWGKVSVKGRLTQNHRAILDAIFAFPICSSRLMDEKGNPGPAVFVVNPYLIAKKAGVCTNREWLEGTILEEMRTATVLIESKSDNKTSCQCAGIVSEWKKDETFNHRGVVKESSLLRITISAAWMTLMDETMGVRYAPLVEKIGKIQSGATQALVRFLLTHTNARFWLKDALTILNAIGPDSSRQVISKTIKSVVENQEVLEREFGIRLEKKESKWLVSYSKHDDVVLSSPSK